MHSLWCAINKIKRSLLVQFVFLRDTQLIHRLAFNFVRYGVALSKLSPCCGKGNTVSTVGRGAPIISRSNRSLWLLGLRYK
jgi:hypothetical protein